jgi:catalase
MTPTKFPTEGAGTVLATVAGPSTGNPPGTSITSKAVPSDLLKKIAGTAELAAAMPNNPNKAAEIGDAAYTPPQGATAMPPSPVVTGSTVSESNASEKVGSGKPPQGVNNTIESLDRVRVDSGDQHLTTNQGVAVADNQNSLKAGLRGPTAMEDFILREKITHFDHERIPERVVHARGSAHTATFECYKSLAPLTQGRTIYRRRQTHAGVRALLDRCRRAWLDRYGARCARLRRQVLYRRRQLGSGRQQHPRVLHSGCNEISRTWCMRSSPSRITQMPQASSAHDTYWDFASLMPGIDAHAACGSCPIAQSRAAIG